MPSSGHARHVPIGAAPYVFAGPLAASGADNAKAPVALPYFQCGQCPGTAMGETGDP
jgi:hypothetical protein